MADASIEADEDPPKKKSKSGLVIAIVALFLGGGGGFFAAGIGFIGGGSSAESHATSDAQVHPETPVYSFVELDPILVSLPSAGGTRHLKFTAQIEVDPAYRTEVEAIRPRLIDLMNRYLRAVEISEFEAPDALILLRAQLLRRLQVIAGDGKIKDLLIMEFVLN